ncbi:MAG: hypothetical protein WD071_14730 [Pseudohongiella sp.]|uniref:hypothetical protein n=1 Tax=Pseudohongiella sp. TaxID=1979412 RepID=UPI0034A033EA
MSRNQADANIYEIEEDDMQQWDDPTPHEINQADSDVAKFSKKYRRQHDDWKIKVFQAK